MIIVHPDWKWKNSLFVFENLWIIESEEKRSMWNRLLCWVEKITYYPYLTYYLFAIAARANRPYHSSLCQQPLPCSVIFWEWNVEKKEFEIYFIYVNRMLLPFDFSKFFLNHMSMLLKINEISLMKVLMSFLVVKFFFINI